MHKVGSTEETSAASSMSSSFLWCEEEHWESSVSVCSPFRLTTFVSSSLFFVVARCVPDLTGEFLLELLPCLSFESRPSFEDPPHFLFHLLETLFIFGACFPVVSTSSQLLTLLTCELLPHRSFIFPLCLDEEADCLVNQGCCFLGSRG